MTQEKKHRGGNASGGFAGVVIWFIGWLFTISFAQLAWWQIIVGIVIWPYFLGLAVR